MNRFYKKIFSCARQSKGTAAIEFALIFPVYFLVVMGIIEFGYVFWGYISLEYGASLGVRYAFANPTATNSDIQAKALSYANFPGTISYSVTLTPNSSVTITGQVHYTFIAVPLSPITITTSLTQLLPPASS